MESTKKDQIVIDLTLEYKQLIEQLKKQTDALRKQIENSNKQSITYKVLFQGLTIFGFVQQPKNPIKFYKTKDQCPVDQVHDAQQILFKNAVYAELEINCGSIYPQTMGFIRAKGKNQAAQQSCKIKIDGKMFIHIGITYPGTQSGLVSNTNIHQLTHILGILVAQSVRFDILQTVKNNYQPEQYKDAITLYQLIFYNFKVKNAQLINGWKADWNKKPDETGVTSEPIKLIQKTKKQLQLQQILKNKDKNNGKNKEEPKKTEQTTQVKEKKEVTLFKMKGKKWQETQLKSIITKLLKKR